MSDALEKKVLGIEWWGAGGIPVEQPLRAYVRSIGDYKPSECITRNHNVKGKSVIAVMIFLGLFLPTAGWTIIMEEGGIFMRVMEERGKE